MGSLTALLPLGSSAIAQLGNQPDDTRIDVSSFPPDIQSGYRVFTSRCSSCHDLALSLKKSPSGWAAEVYRMQAMANSNTSVKEANQIVKFLTYNETHREPVEHNASGAAVVSSSAPAGKQLLDSYGCSACHSVAAADNDSIPLDGIGSKTTPDGLKNFIPQHIACISRLQMEVPDKDLTSLAAYLATLKSN